MCCRTIPAHWITSLHTVQWRWGVWVCCWVLLEHSVREKRVQTKSTDSEMNYLMDVTILTNNPDTSSVVIFLLFKSAPKKTEPSHRSRRVLPTYKHLQHRWIKKTNDFTSIFLTISKPSITFPEKVKNKKKILINQQKERVIFFNILGVLTKNNMLRIQPVTVSAGDEELTAVCPRTAVCLSGETMKENGQRTILKTMFVLTK